MIWDDGRVLAGKEISRTETKEATVINYEYRFKKIDTQAIQALLRSIEANLQFKGRMVRIQELGPEAGYRSLLVNYSGGTLDVCTWELHEPSRVESFANFNVLVPDEKNQGAKLLLPEFVRAWKAIKKDMLDLCDSVIKDSQSVDV